MVVYLINYTVFASFRCCIKRLIRLLDAKRTIIVKYPTLYRVKRMKKAELLFVDKLLRIKTLSNNE